MYPPRDGDMPYDLLAMHMYEVLREIRNAEIYLKWTCPKCGERVASDKKTELTPDHRVVFASAYQHTEKEDGSPCGHQVSTTEYKFGYTLMASSHPLPTSR